LRGALVKQKEENPNCTREMERMGYWIMLRKGPVHFFGGNCRGERGNKFAPRKGEKKNSYFYLLGNNPTKKKPRGKKSRTSKVQPFRKKEQPMRTETLNPH